jgi:hypothetical protein
VAHGGRAIGRQTEEEQVSVAALIMRAVARSYQTGSNEAAKSYLEIGLGRFWNRNFKTKEILSVVLRTDDFHEW